MAVRFPHSVEKIGGDAMPDDRLLTLRAKADQVLFILVEVKAGLCDVNGPWSREEKGNMQRAVSRLGFVASEAELDCVANAMYRSLRWEDHAHVLQYVSVGARENTRLSNLYPDLVQITWEEIGRFLYYRFKEFPQKLNIGPIHRQWPKFGRDYGEYSRVAAKADSVQAVERYVETGDLAPNPST